MSDNTNVNINTLDNKQVNENTIDKEKFVNEVYEAALEKYRLLDLKFTLRGVKRALDKYKTTLIMLRGCKFADGGYETYQPINATFTLIKIGLFSNNPQMGEQELEDRAYDIMDDWRETVGAYESLHALIIDDLEEHGFFVRDLDMAVLQKMNSKDSMKDLVGRAVLTNIQAKAEQHAVYTNFSQMDR